MRKKVLTALRDKQGHWVSGEALALELDVTRTAIWKQIKVLRAEGYVVDTSPGKGYCLSALPDILTEEQVQFGLTTQVFAQEHYFYFREIGSTNDYAKKLASQGYPDGTLVLAEKQTAGRGRRGREWHSGHYQGIYFSLILRPALALREIFRVTPFIALAIAETLQELFGLEPGIKWPNDVLISGRKVAGILTEAATNMDGIDYIIIGIGLNANQQIRDFPEDIRHRATSIREEIKRPVKRVELLQRLLLQLELRYRQLLSGEYNEIIERVRSLSLVIGHDIEVDNGAGKMRGKAIGIDDNGILLLRDPQGNIHNIISGEVLIPPQIS